MGLHGALGTHFPGISLNSAVGFVRGQFWSLAFLALLFGRVSNNVREDIVLDVFTIGLFVSLTSAIAGLTAYARKHGLN